MIVARSTLYLHLLVSLCASALTSRRDDSADASVGNTLDSDFDSAEASACSTTDSMGESLAVGGQAVMEGVMMRNGSHLAMAVRTPNGEIQAITRPWVTFFPPNITRKKWIRGFPVLAETMVNGIRALNKSAELAAGPDEADQLKPWQITLTLLVAVGMALLLFVVVPHFLTMGLTALSVAGKVEGISFHIWDGLLKFLMFLAYIVLISRLEDIRRVFQYHGAEHKCIAAYEHKENPVSAESAARYSRLHPRCGTTFLLFVMVISIFVHIIFVPGLLVFWAPPNAIAKHSVVLVLKLFLVIPISALAYETIRTAATITSPVLGAVLRSPGLLLQVLTTREPDKAQLEVALVALKEALAARAVVPIVTPAYTTLESVWSVPDARQA